MRTYFDHEKLKVYQSAIAFVTWSTDLLTQVKAKAAVKERLDRTLLDRVAIENGKAHLLEIVLMARIQEEP